MIQDIILKITEELPLELNNIIFSYRGVHPLAMLIKCYSCGTTTTGNDRNWEDTLEIFYNKLDDEDWYYHLTALFRKPTKKRDINTKPCGFHMICSNCIYEDSKG